MKCLVLFFGEKLAFQLRQEMLAPSKGMLAPLSANAGTPSCRYTRNIGTPLKLQREGVKTFSADPKQMLAPLTVNVGTPSRRGTEMLARL